MRPSYIWRALFLAAAITAAGFSDADQTFGGEPAVLSSSVVSSAGIPDGYEVRDTVIHATTGRRAIIAEKEGKQYVFALDRREGPYDRVTMLSFSKDGGAVAYSASDSENAYCVADGVRSAPYSTVCNPTFSDDRRLITFEASVNGKYFIVYGDAGLKQLHESPRYDMSVMRPEFSSDGTKIFFVLDDAKASKIHRFITDTTSGKNSTATFDSFVDFKKSPDGTWYAYKVRQKGRHVVVSGTFDALGEDERRGEPYDQAGDLFLSPQEKSFAYVATKSGKQFIVKGNVGSGRLQEGALHDSVAILGFEDGGKMVRCTNLDGATVTESIEKIGQTP